MPKNQVSDLITDQEIAFARLILSGTMTDRAAAQAVGLNPDTAAYTKSKPRVRAYMIEHRAAVQQQFVEQETEGLRRQNQWREQVLDRLWEIANLPAEMTRGSITGQVKALSGVPISRRWLANSAGVVARKRVNSRSRSAAGMLALPSPAGAAQVTTARSRWSAQAADRTAATRRGCARRPRSGRGRRPGTRWRRWSTAARTSRWMVRRSCGHRPVCDSPSRNARRYQHRNRRC